MEINRASVSFIIVCYQSSIALKTLLLSIPKEYEVILVDNSQDKKTEEIANIYDCILIKNEKNVGFGSASNIGAKVANGDFLFFINPDSSLNPDSVEELLRAAKTYPQASGFNPKICDQSGRQNFKRRSVLLPKSEWMGKKYPSADKQVSILSGAAIFIKKDLFLKVSGFDEKIFLYHEDDDLSIRLKKEIGPLMYINNSKVTHVGGGSSSRNTSIAALKGYYMGKSRVYAQAKHKIKGVNLRNILLASFQLISPEMIFSARKRAKYIAFFKGVIEQIFFKTKVN
jgi:GT2 family glycosyltransferase